MRPLSTPPLPLNVLAVSPPGWGAAFGCAGLLLVFNLGVWLIVSMAVEGTRSALAGIRLPSLMTSDQAWRAGHAAARRSMAPLLAVAAALAVASVPLQLRPAVYITVLAASLLCTLASVALGSVRASRAARRVPS